MSTDDVHRAQPTSTGGATRVLLWCVCVVAALAGIAILVVETTRIIVDAAHGRAPISLLGALQLMPSGSITTSGYSIGLLVFDVPAAGIWLACIAAIVQALTQAFLCGLVALLAWRLLRQAPFRRTLSRLTVIGGAWLLVGGVVSQLFVLLANGISLAAIDETHLQGRWPLAGPFDPSFIGIGVLLILTGAAFRVGERMQRDTEGLV